MAELAGDRGQQLLVGSIALAVSLVVLVAVLNGVLFAEDLRTREAAPDLGHAADHEVVVDEEYGRLLRRADDERFTSTAAARTAVADRTYAINALVGAHLAGGHGVYATFDPPRLTNGTVLAQSEECELLAAHTACGNGSTNIPPYPTFTYYDDSDGLVAEVLGKQDPPHYPAAGERLYLNASNATDPDGSDALLSYEWTVREDGQVWTRNGETPDGINVTTTGTYEVILKVTDENGSTSTISIGIPVYDPDHGSGELPPNGSYTHTPSVPVRDRQTTFDAAYSSDVNGDITGYEWDFDGDGSTDATGETVTHTFASAGVHEVTLTVTDSLGMNDTVRKEVRVDEPTSAGGGVHPRAPFGLGVPGPKAGGPADIPEVGSRPNAVDWRLVRTDRLRSFHLTPVTSTLEQVPRVSADDSEALEETLYVRFTGAEGNTWDVHFFRIGSKLAVSTRTNGTGGNATLRYEQQTAGVQVNLTTVTITGQRRFPFAPNLKRPYRVGVRNGDEGNATYSLVVPDSSMSTTDVRHGNFHPAGSGRSPYEAATVYEMVVPVTFDTPTVSRDATVRVAPREPSPFDIGKRIAVADPHYVPRDEIVYESTNTGYLSSIDASGNRTTYDVADPQVIGPKSVDFDGDGLAEVPYVNTSSYLKLIDENNETQVLASNAVKSKSLIGLGRWNGSLSVLYTGKDDSGNTRVFQVTLTEGPYEVPVVGTDNGVDGVAGVADWNGDGDHDLITASGSQQLYYYDNGSNNKINNGGIGSNNGIGMGAPREMDGSAPVEVPMVDSSNNLRTITRLGRSNKLVQGVYKSPVAGIQWTEGTDDLELLFIDGGYVYYLPDDGGTPIRVETQSGTDVQADDDQGVA